MGGLDLGWLLPAPPLVPICTSRARREGHNNDVTKRYEAMFSTIANLQHPHMCSEYAGDTKRPMPASLLA